MNALWITLAMLVAGFVGWPVTALVFGLARTIDDRTIDDRTNDDRTPGDGGAGSAGGDAAAEDPAADSTADVAGPPPAVGPAEPADAASSAAPAVPPAIPPAAADNATDDAAISSARILRGGAIIGVLERFAVCLAILAGQPVAIAYVVAVKGLGRFAELKATPVAAERFIIGTLTSMLWAAGVAALAKFLVLG